MRTQKYSMTHSQALQVLSLAAGASKKRLKTAYRRAAMKHHPDKGGDQECFILAKEAYDLLVEQGTTERHEPQQGFSHLEGFGNPFAGVEVRVRYQKQSDTPTAEERWNAHREAMRTAAAAGVSFSTAAWGIFFNRT